MVDESDVVILPSPVVVFVGNCLMMSSEIHIEDAAPLQAEGVAVDLYGWFNLHKLSMCLAAAYAAYYLLVIVRVRPVFCVKSIIW